MITCAPLHHRVALAATLAALALPPRAGAQASDHAGAAALPAATLLWQIPPNGVVASRATWDAGRRERSTCAGSVTIVGGPAAGTLAPAGTHLASLLAGSVDRPLCGRWPLVLSARGEATTRFAPVQLGSRRATVAVARPTTMGSMWLAYGSSAALVERPSLVARDSGRSERAGSVLDRDMLQELALGASHRIGAMMLSISAGGARAVVRDEVDTPVRTVPDSVWNDSSGWVRSVREVGGGRTVRALASRWMTGAVNAYWTRERFALAGTIGGWMPSGNGRGRGWGALEVARRIEPGLWLVAGAGVRPDASRGAAARGRYSTVGLRFAWGTHGRPRDAAPRTEDARAFTVIPAGAGAYIISLYASGARRVELSGDFTGWTAISLAPAAGGWWVATVRLAPGAYRVNVRIDGGSWRAPPGTTPVADDFGGTAGFMVVPER